MFKSTQLPEVVEYFRQGSELVSRKSGYRVAHDERSIRKIAIAFPHIFQGAQQRDLCPYARCIKRIK